MSECESEHDTLSSLDADQLSLLLLRLLLAGGDGVRPWRNLDGEVFVWRWGLMLSRQKNGIEKDRKIRQ